MKHVGIKDFNEAEVLTILEQLKICSSLNNQGLVVVEESDSSNMDNLKKVLSIFYLMKIKSLPSCVWCFSMQIIQLTAWQMH